MPDRPPEIPMPPPDAWDDDRLLACVLGLDDDSELLEAAAGDAALAGRLAAMRHEVAAVEMGVRRAVPVPDDEYTDLAAARWDAMRLYFKPRPDRGSRTRLRRRLRVALPLLAVAVLALTVGLTAVYRARDQVAVDAQREEAAPMTQSTGGGIAGTSATFAEQLDRFAVVVVVKARTATGALQRFTVVRVLKGEAPAVKILQLRVGDSPAVPGRLHVLLLRPMTRAAAEEFGTGALQGPALTKGDGGPGRTIPAYYSYQGELAVARELPSDTNPQSVVLP